MVKNYGSLLTKSRQLRLSSNYSEIKTNIARAPHKAVAKLNGVKPIRLLAKLAVSNGGLSSYIEDKRHSLRKGNYLDNSTMESFFVRLKTECYFGKRFETVEQLEQSIREYIYYYNHERIQVKLKRLSPVQYRT